MICNIADAEAALKNCPFCGGGFIVDYIGDGYDAQCENAGLVCPVSGPVCPTISFETYDTIDELVKAMNTRNAT